MKMVQAGVVTGPIERSNAPKQTSGAPAPTPPVHDLNVPYEGTEEYETPTAEILFPPVSLFFCLIIPIPLIKWKKTEVFFFGLTVLAVEFLMWILYADTIADSNSNTFTRNGGQLDV